MHLENVCIPNCIYFHFSISWITLYTVRNRNILYAQVVKRRCVIKKTPWTGIKEWAYSSNILNLCTRWRWMASFGIQPLYPPGISPQCRLYTMLCEPTLDLDLMGENTSCPYRESKSSHPSHIPLVQESNQFFLWAQTDTWVLVLCLQFSKPSLNTNCLLWFGLRNIVVLRVYTLASHRYLCGRRFYSNKQHV
jgi:hypothetical protein